ncbi:MAG: Rieske (2Fe-2S) protein [Dehalococcoidales bacterium]|nr:Rieske (2Fe-2S) protein [Dehalococcoidales bacterium]
MSNFVEVGKTGELEEGAMKEVLVRDRAVLLTRIGDSYYVADNRCPHMGGKLSSGKLEGSIVTCPLHGSQFDLRNGQVVRWLKGSGLLAKVSKILKSPRQLTTYNVRVESDKILIEM